MNNENNVNVEVENNVNIEEVTCCNCDNVINGNSYDTQDGMACDDCYNSDYEICDDCGEFVHRDNVYHFECCGEERCTCETCYDENYIRCTDCETIVNVDNATYINGREVYVCDDCSNNYYCDRCETYHSSVREYSTTNGTENLCDDCVSEYYECEDCGDLVPGGEGHYNEDTDCYYCDCCYNDRSSNSQYIDNYSFKPYPKFYQTINDNKVVNLYFGTELELEYIRDTFCKDILDIVNETPLEDIFYFKQDGSLNCDDSVEVVSHPFTYNFLIENLGTFKEVFDYIYQNSDTSSRTGLHIHTSRNYFESEESIDKFILFFEYYMNEIKILSKRHTFYYCGFLQEKLSFSSELAKKMSVTKDEVNKNKNRTDRYSCVNIENSRTIECRVFEATKDLNTYIAYIELLQALIDTCNTKNETEFGFDTILKQSHTSHLKEFVTSINLTIPKGNMKVNKIHIIRESNKAKKQVIEVKKQILDTIDNYLMKLSKNEVEKMRDYYINYALLRLKRYIRKELTNTKICHITLDNFHSYLSNTILYSITSHLNTNDFSKRQKDLYNKLYDFERQVNSLKGGVL